MVHNPYAPPDAPVLDIESPGDGPTRPWQVTAAVGLCWITIAMVLPDGVLHVIHGTPRGFTRTTYLVVVAIYYAVVLSLLALLYVSIYRGRRWARNLYAALVLLGIVAAYWIAPARWAEGGYTWVSYLLGTLFDWINTILLFTPAPNAWFRQRARAAR